MIKVVHIVNDISTDISAFCGNITRRDNVDSLGVELGFEYLNNRIYDDYTAFTDIQLGQTICFYDNNELIFQGQIIKLTRSNPSHYSVTCFDNAFYLNKTNVKIQFSNMDVKSAIEKLCSQNYIPCKVDCDIATKVTKIYNYESISSIIDDLLKQATNDTGLKYRREYNYGSLYVNAMNNLKMIWQSKPLVSEFSYDSDLTNFANRVVVVSSSEKNTTVFAEAKNGDSIKLYGQYTHYEKVDDKNKATAQTIANQKLKELSRMVDSVSVTLLGDNYVRAGRILQFAQPAIGLEGNYLVHECEHSYTGVLHTMTCQIKKEDVS